ncbi:MAG: preprotein translocase subunit SecA [Methylobacter sp.]
MSDTGFDTADMASYADGVRHFAKPAGPDNKPRPGVLLGRYPQKKETRNTDFEKLIARWAAGAKFLCTRQKYSQNYIVSRINDYEHDLKQLSEPDLTVQIAYIREKLLRSGLQEPLIIQAFATIREAAVRTLGKRHFDTQLLGGWVMIHGMVAQMQTGEGKTLATTLPACTAALAGIPVHVITANDYLAARDAELLQPLYQRLGLVAGSVIDGMETDQRRKIYAGDIVHTTHKQIAFDYLRDKIAMAEDTTPFRLQFKQIQKERRHSSRLFLRGLCFAIIDEADSVLIDEAGTPLIISKNLPAEDSEAVYAGALHLASRLIINEHFTVDFDQRTLTLTEAGENHLLEAAQAMAELWQSKRQRNALITQALTAQYLFIVNKHYLVSDGKIQLIDQLTGRVMADRSWEQGLHQMIEAKESCAITHQREPLARISYQRFFSRYLKLAGTSGTAKEVATELHAVYGLHVVDIPTYKPCQRKMLPERLYLTADAKWAALITRIKELNRLGRPILIGTCSVAESEEISAKLTAHRLPHQVLNAKQNKHEAKIIARAGQSGNITVATNMAGRGTDIELDARVIALGGLHVIAMARNDALRIDRQLYGRCARQGDPGSAEAFISLQDERIARAYPESLLKIFSGLAGNEQLVPERLARIILRWPQKKIENQQAEIRDQLMKQDKQRARILAFSGRFE